MSYLNSLEYTESRDKLQGEYKDTFHTIESYYIRVYTNQSYEVQLTLSQILADFLMAQEEGKPLNRITGTDIRKYATRMLKTELSAYKGIFYWVFNLMAILWLVFFFLLFGVLMAKEYRGYPFMEKMDHLYITLFLVIIFVITFILGFIRAKISAVLFFRPKLIGVISLLYYMIFAVIINQYSDYIRENSNDISGIKIPAPAVLVLFPLITVFFVIAGILSYRKTRAKKQKLQESEELIPEQKICPSCGKEHDLDYPKCPYCGFRKDETK